MAYPQCIDSRKTLNKLDTPTLAKLATNKAIYFGSLCVEDKKNYIDYIYECLKYY